jgi:hypothetical protein
MVMEFERGSTTFALSELSLNEAMDLSQDRIMQWSEHCVNII